MTQMQLSDELAATASEWYVRRQDTSWTGSDERAFQAWLSAEPVHSLAYRQLSRTWSDFSHVPRPYLSVDASPVAPKARRSRWSAAAGWPRRFTWPAMPWPSLLATSLVLCVFLGGGWYAHDRVPRYSAALDTARGQLRAVSLPDGSRVTLNMGSRLRIDYYARRREVVLEDGEAFFEVAPDASRPFTVAAREGTVRVLGTVFEVRTQPSGLRVEVVQGRVQVHPGKEPGEAVVLGAREGLRLDAGTGRAERFAADVDEIGQWRNGQLVFRRTPLAEVAQELSRYLGAPVRLSGPRVADLRVSGFATTRAPQDFIEALPDLMAVRVQKDSAGGYLITAR